MACTQLIEHPLLATEEEERHIHHLAASFSTIVHKVGVVFHCMLHQNAMQFSSLTYYVLPLEFHPLMLFYSGLKNRNFETVATVVIV